MISNMIDVSCDNSASSTSLPVKTVSISLILTLMRAAPCAHAQYTDEIIRLSTASINMPENFSATIRSISCCFLIYWEWRLLKRNEVPVTSSKLKMILSIRKIWTRRTSWCFSAMMKIISSMAFLYPISEIAAWAE